MKQKPKNVNLYEMTDEDFAKFKKICKEEGLVMGTLLKNYIKKFINDYESKGIENDRF